MPNEVIVTEQTIEAGISDINTRALSITISDNETYSMAGEVLIMSKELEKKIKEFFKPLKEKAHTAWKALCTAENQELEKLNPGINHIKKQIAIYQVEQEKIRREKEKQLRQEALKAEEERRLQEALQLEKEGHTEEAQEILDEPVFVPPPIVEKTVPKVSGISMRQEWDFEIINESIIPRQYLEPNLVAIRATVKALKDKANISGIKIFQKAVVAAGRR